MAYRIEIQESTGLWIVLFNGEILGRAAQPQTAITLARQRVDQINDPVTGRGAGSLPPISQQLVTQLQQQATAIEDARQAALEAEIRAAETQGSGAVSTGDTASVAGVSTQSPGVGAESAGVTGGITPTPATTAPSNAIPAVDLPVDPGAAPPLLPASTTGTQTAVPGASGTPGGGQIPNTVAPTRNVDLLQPVPNNYTNIYIYQAIMVTSIFNQGRFTQEIEGVQKFYNPGQQAAPTAGNRTTNAANTTGPAASLVRQPQGAVGSSASVNFAGSELGAFFNNGDTGAGAVNFRPTGLAQVLNRQTPITPIVADPGVSGRNVADEFGAILFPSDTTDIAPARKLPPTSNGGTVTLPSTANGPTVTNQPNQNITKER